MASAQELPKFFPVWDRTLPTPLTGGLYCIGATMLQSVYTLPYLGRWNEEYEGFYQRLRQVVLPFQRATHDPTALKLMYESTPCRVGRRFHELSRLAICAAVQLPAEARARRSGRLFDLDLPTLGRGHRRGDSTEHRASCCLGPTEWNPSNRPKGRNNDDPGPQCHTSATPTVTACST